jgi:hypothetical protein
MEAATSFKHHGSVQQDKDYNLEDADNDVKNQLITSVPVSVSVSASLASIIRTNTHLFVDPLVCTPHHLQHLKVRVSVSVAVSTSTSTSTSTSVSTSLASTPATTSSPGLCQPHRATCTTCNQCGDVPPYVFQRLRSCRSCSDKDHGLTQRIQVATESFRTFTAFREFPVPFYYGGKRKSCIVLPLATYSRGRASLEVPLVDVTHESFQQQ